VKISARGFSVRRRQNPEKKLAESLCTRWRAWGQRGGGEQNPLMNEILHKGKYPPTSPPTPNFVAIGTEVCC